MTRTHFGGMRNVTVTDQIWTGGQPSLADLDLAERRGVRQIIDLRSEGESRVKGEPDLDLLSACEALGIESVHIPIPLNYLSPSAEEAVDRVLALLNRGLPTLLVCEDGRTSAMLLSVHNLASGVVMPEEAASEAERVGLLSREQTAFLGSVARSQMSRTRCWPDFL